MGNRISTEDLYKITQSLADRAVSDVKKRREDERKREEAIKKNREERLAAAAKQNRIPNYKGGSLWDQYKAALASGEAKNASDFITKRDARNAAWNKVGAETLNDDMEALAKSISSTYGTQFDPSKYYSQETINGSSDQVKKMRDRLNALAEYYNTYGGSDDQKKAVGEQIKAYDSELKFLNDLGAHYGQYKNEADFNYRTDKRRDEDYIVNDYDAEAGKKNLAELKGYLDRINTSSDSLSTGQLISNARSGKKAYNRTAINEAKQQYGLDGMTDDEILNWLTQEYQLESFALNNVDRMRTAAGYRNLANNDDFLQGVISGKAVENPTFEDYLNYENEMFRLAEKVNSGVATKEEQQQYAELSENAPTVNNRFRFLEDVQSGKYGGQGYEQNSTYSGLDKALLNSKQYHYEQMTDDEKRVYYYLLGTQGAEAADRYLDDLKTTLDYRNTEEVKQYIRDLKNSKIFGNVSAAALANTFGGLGGAALGYLIADSNEGVNKTAGDIAYSAASVPLNVLGGAISTVGEIGQRLDLASKGDWEGKGYNPYANYNLFSVAGREARGLVAKDIEDKIGWEMFGQNVMSQVYQSLMSGVDSAFGMATLGKLYTISMGGSAAASKAAELYESGASSSQIYWESLFSGIAEATFEYLSIENLSSIKSIVESKPTTLKKAVKMILTQNGIEASEEVFTEIANMVIDKGIKKYDSDYDRKVTEYVRDGMTREEAVKKAAGEVAADIGWAGAGGFISGFASSTLTIAGAYRAGKENADAQISAIDPGNAEGLYNNAKNIDYSILNDASEALKKGDAKAAAEIISEGKDWYEYLKSYAKEKYGKNQASEISANIDASIDNLNQIKNLISSGDINADSIQAVLEKAKSAQDTKVDVTSANDEKLFSLLAKGEPSNSVIEKNILKDRGTLAAFERLTGLRIGGTTVSQKRAAVREAFRAVSSSSETLKAAQNAIESGATATEGHKNAAVIIDQAMQANRAENSRLRNSEKVKSAETKAAIDATNRQHRFLETVRNYVINGGDLSGFTESPISNVSGEGSTNSSETKTTQETVKKRVKADFSAYQDERYSAEDASALANLNSKAEQDAFFRNENAGIEQEIKNIESSDSITAEEKAQRIGELKEAASRNNSLAKAMDDFREMGRLVRAGEVDKVIDSLRKPLKKMGVNIEVVDNVEAADGMKSGAYFDKSTNTIKVSRDWNGVENVVKLELAADGNGFVLNPGKSVSFDRAVTQTIAHEIAHADSGLTLDFIKAVAGTQYDAFDLKGRLEHPDDRSWRSEDAQKEKNWRRYVDAYTEQAMLEMKGTEEQRRASAEKVVNDAYIFEEIMADMFGAAVDDMGHSSRAGENIFWAMNRNKPGIIKRILNALERFIARIRGKDAYLAVEQRQAAERLRDMLTGELKRAYGTDVKGEAAVESDGGKRHSLAGQYSQTAKLNSLSGAVRMNENGTPMDTIRARTGWWLGKDGKWRYEIDDSALSFDRNGYTDNAVYLADYARHDKLFAAYPWLRGVKLKIVDVIAGNENLNGLYNHHNDTIYLKDGRTDKQMKSTLLHELQHVIQEYEGFATGANPNAAAALLLNSAYNDLKRDSRFAKIKSPDEKMRIVKQYIERTTGNSFESQAQNYYYTNYGEQESRAVQERYAPTNDTGNDQIEVALYHNDGVIYDVSEEIDKAIDNLKEMGYNEKQVNSIIKRGIQNADLSGSGSESANSQNAWRRNNNGATEQSRGTGNEKRLGDGVRRRGDNQGTSETESSGRGVQRVLNEVSKPEKRFSLSSADTDIYSRIFDMQREETELTNRIREIEKSDAFKKANDDLSKAINNDNIAEGMKAYQAWRKESGYADLVDRRDALRAELEEIRTKAYNDAVSKAINEERTAIEKSGLSEADYFRKQAVKEFGYTPYFYDAGYIMPNGKMLNFSGEKGQHYGSRGQDHRAIGTIYADTNGTDALVRFMNDGNIRIMAETPGLDISASTEPSKEQYTTIRRFANEFSDGGYFAVDLSDENGKTVGTLEYEGNINPTRIVNDIKHFYETGEVREQSGLDRFRYSLTRANDEYMKAVESGNVEEQQRLVDEAAENAGYDTVLYHGTQSFGFTQIDVSKYSDDGMSFFATSNPEMAQTYSAKSGTREISRKSGIENLSLPQVVDRLNAVAAADTSDYDRYTYRIMNRSDAETLKKSIQSGIKELRAETERLISEYADRLAKDFNGEDELKHSRLRSLLNALDSDSASKLSANLYTVLNHNEIFDDAAKVKFGNFEADIRLLEKLAALKTDEDVVVREDTDRYDIVVEDQEKARKRLEKLDNSGNYVLRGRTEGFLEIDGNGHNWNDIFTTLEPKGGNTLKAEYDFGSESLKLSDRDGEFAVIPAKSVADAVSPMARAFARRYGTTFATTVLAQTKDQLKNSATAEVKIKSTGKTNTRDIANFAREQGYPGVKITDIYDNGGRGSEAGRGDVYIFFNPEQDVKSADPITYDDSGNVIPLTERFDSGNRDIRWSLAGTNKDGIEVYETSDDIKNLTNKDRMQRFEEIMKNDYRGRTAKFIRNGHAYYATFEDTDVKKNIYGDNQSSKAGWKAKIRAGADGDIFELVEDADYTGSGAEQGKSNSAHKGINFWDYYVKTVQIDNEVYDLLANVRRNDDDSYVYNIRLYQNKKIKASPPIGIQTNSVKSGAQRSDNRVSQNDSVVNTQSMQDVEKDSSDERHSLVKYAQSELKALQKENEKLRQDVDDLKQELQLTHGRKLSRDALISSIQKILIDRYGVKLSAKELYPHVTNLYDMFYNNTVDGKRLKKDERVDTMRIIEEMDKIVDAVIENAVGVDDTYVEMKKLLPELRNTKLVVPVDARADAAQNAGFENWAEFRKANFGRVGFANEGLPVDTYYMELSERYPELFPDGITHPGEQAAHIADVVNTIRESGINEYQLYDIEDERIRTSIKNDVMDIIGNAEKLQTFADRAAQKVEDTKLAEAMHYGADIAKLKRLNSEKVADIKAENRKRLSDMRRKYQDRVESVRERYAEARANRSEKQKQTVLRNKVLRKYTEASTMLDRPTTENHFTEAMRKPLMEFLAAVDITTGKSVAKQGVYDRILRVIEAANNATAEDGKNGLDIAETDLNVQEKQLIVDSGLLERMAAWVEANKGKKLTELSSAQLEELNGIFNQLKHLTAEIKRLYDPREGLAAKSWQAQKEIGLAKNRDRKTRVLTGFNTLRKGLEWVHYGSIDAYGFFNGIDSDVMDEQLRTFRKCQDKFGANIELLSSLMSDAVGKEGIPEGWHGKKAKEITLNLSTGTLRATPSQLMTVYLLLNQEDSRRCLFNKDGGLVIGKFKAKAAVQTKENRTRNWRLFRTMSVFNEQSGKLVLNEADANKIIESLTDAQIECADRISAILNGEAARLGNEVSMAMYGYKKYTTENYFPMRTVDDYRAIENNPNNEMTLLGLSFTHERTRLAGKALVAEDIFDVVGRHLTNMAQYNAFAQELDNAKKMYALRLGNGTSLKQTLIRQYGGQADKFYRNLINNLSGTEIYASQGVEAFSEKLLSNYKAAAVAKNISVVLKQPMSIFRALSEFSSAGIKAWNSFKDLSPSQVKAEMNEMLEHSGVAKLKNWGASENMTRKSFEELYNNEQKNFLVKINDAMDSGAEFADMWTWSRLWRMSKAEIDAQNKYTKGSKEYFEAVNSKFSEVIGKTQVVQSALDSSMAVQNAGTASKFLYAFQNEPLKQYSYLTSAINDAVRGKPGAKKKLVKVIASSVANTVAVSAITTLVSLWRGTLDRDDDDELWDDILKSFSENALKDILSGGLAPVWQLAETVWTAIESGAFGKTVERMDLAALTDLGGLINKYLISQNGGCPNLGMLQDIVNAASNLFGWSAKNVIRDFKAGLDRIIFDSGLVSPMTQYNYLKAWKDVELTNKAAVTEAYYDVLRDAVDRGRYSDYVKIKRDMIYHGYTETKIKNAVMKSSLMDDLYELKKVNPGSYKAKVNSIVSSVSAVSSLEGKEFEDFIESAMKRREREDGGSRTDDEVYDEMHRKMEKEVKEQLIYIDVSKRAAYIKKMLKTYGEYGITEADILKVLRKAGKA